MIMKLMKQKINKYFFCYVNTSHRHRFYTYMYYLLNSYNDPRVKLQGKDRLLPSVLPTCDYRADDDDAF